MSEPFPLRGESIIVFAKDWGHDPTSCNQVMRILARENRVLWLNSIASRTPNLTRGRDLGKIARKLLSFLRGSRRVADNIWVYTPLVLPLHQKGWAVGLNRVLLRITLSLLRRSLGMKEFQLWVWVPTVAEYARHLGARGVVYYYTDNWSSFSGLDADRTREWVERLARESEAVFATSLGLAEQLRSVCPHVRSAPHGVEWEKFRAALDPDTPIPENIADLVALGRPIVGYFGLVEDWLDLDMLTAIAGTRPDWTFVFVGNVAVPVERLEALPNVRFVGRQPHDLLPGYCKAFSVGLIPHRLNELTLHMNPIKLREYMSAGLPVVAADLPEVRPFAAQVRVAQGAVEFEAAIAAAIEESTPERRREISDSMRGSTWEARVAEIAAHVQGAIPR